MNFAEKLKLVLEKFRKKDIILTNHAVEQAIFRGIDLEEIKDNIINPHRLVYARKQKAARKDEEKYDCYFIYSKTQCQRYILVIKNKCVVCTVIKINRRWQRRFEKNGRI